MLKLISCWPCYQVLFLLSSFSPDLQNLGATPKSGRASRRPGRRTLQKNLHVIRLNRMLTFRHILASVANLETNHPSILFGTKHRPSPAEPKLAQQPVSSPQTTATCPPPPAIKKSFTRIREKGLMVGGEVSVGYTAAPDRTDGATHHSSLTSSSFSAYVQPCTTRA